MDGSLKLKNPFVMTMHYIVSKLNNFHNSIVKLTTWHFTSEKALKYLYKYKNCCIYLTPFFINQTMFSLSAELIAENHCTLYRCALFAKSLQTGICFDRHCLIYQLREEICKRMYLWAVFFNLSPIVVSNGIQVNH